MPDDLLYPEPADIFSIHEDIVAEDEETEAGVRSPGAVESALRYVSVGYFDRNPETIHGKAAHLMRLLVVDHPFVDGNKRTALNTVAVFYELNGYEFRYDDETIREILKQFGTDAGDLEMDCVIAYVRRCTEPDEE